MSGHVGEQPCLNLIQKPPVHSPDRERKVRDQHVRRDDRDGHTSAVADAAPRPLVSPGTPSAGAPRRGGRVGGALDLFLLRGHPGGLAPAPSLLTVEEWRVRRRGPAGPAVPQPPTHARDRQILQGSLFVRGWHRGGPRADDGRFFAAGAAAVAADEPVQNGDRWPGHFLEAGGGMGGSLELGNRVVAISMQSGDEAFESKVSTAN